MIGPPILAPPGARRRRGSRLAPALLWVLAVPLAAITALAFAPDAWYRGLRKPSFAPPSAGAVLIWLLNHVLLAAAAWLLAADRRATESRRRIALTLFGLQLALGALWPPLLFGAHALGFAVADLAALWLTAAAALLASTAVRSAAAWLLTPYLLWLSYLLVVYGAIWLMNA